MAKKTYQVLVPVNHNGDDYKPGDPIDLEDKHAKPLLDVKAIAEPEPEKAKDKK